MDEGAGVGGVDAIPPSEVPVDANGAPAVEDDIVMEPMSPPRQDNEEAEQGEGAAGKVMGPEKRPRGADKDKRSFKKPKLDSKKKELKFVCTRRFWNELPELPYDPKTMSYPFDPMRFVNYKTTILEKTCKVPLLTEPDLGMTFDIIDSEIYAKHDGAKLDPEDKAILTGQLGLKKKEDTNKQYNQTWLMKTTYMSNNLLETTNNFSRGQVEARPAGNVSIEDREANMDRGEQIEYIRKTFDNALQDPVHPTKPGLKAVEVTPLLPDFELFENQYFHAVFDKDTKAYARGYEVKNVEEYTPSLLRGHNSRKKEVSYFVLRDTVENKQEYGWERAYKTQFTTYDGARNARHEDFALFFKEGKTTYCPMTTRMNLTRTARDEDDLEQDQWHADKLIVSTREATQLEEYQRRRAKATLTGEAFDEEQPMEELAETREGNDGENGAKDHGDGDEEEARKAEEVKRRRLADVFGVDDEEEEDNAGDNDE